MKVINVVCGIDDKYYQHCAVMLVSLIKSTNRKFNIYILSLNVNENHKSLLREMIISLGSEVQILDVSSDWVQQFPIRRRDYLSLATYLRLFIPQLLPPEIDKVLYVDSDIVFNGDISELYDVDLSNYSLAGIEDAPNLHPLRLSYNEADSYFNAGLILLNLEYLRGIDFTNLAQKYIRENFAKIRLHDQDVLNALLHGTVLFLDIKWNMLDCFFFNPPLIASKYMEDLAKNRETPIVIHYSGPLKPWHKGCRHPMKNIYFHYANMISWSNKRVSYFFVFKKFKFIIALFILCGDTPEKAKYKYKRFKSLFKITP